MDIKEIFKSSLRKIVNQYLGYYDHFIIVESSENDDSKAQKLLIKNNKLSGDIDTLHLAGDASFFYQLFNKSFLIDGIERSFEVSEEQFFQPPNFKQDFGNPYLKNYVNNRYIVDSIEACREENSVAKINKNTCIFGIVDRDFEKHLKDNEKYDDIGVTEYHDRETTIFGAYLSEIIKSIANDRKIKLEKAVDDFVEMFDFCIKQGMLEQSSFEVTGRKDFPNDKELKRAFINITHSNYKDGSSEEDFTSEMLESKFANDIDIKKTEFPKYSEWFDLLVEKYESKKNAFDKETFKAVIKEILSAPNPNEIIKNNNNLKYYFKIVNGHILFRQLIRHGLCFESNCNEHDLWKTLEKDIVLKDDNYRRLQDLGPVYKYIQYRMKVLKR